MTQRECMRMLYKRFTGNANMIIEAYAAAEINRQVERRSNTHDLSPIQYAKALYLDGIRREWIFNK